VKQRCAELKITELYQCVENKLFKLKDICAKKGLILSQVAYIGDDVNDLPCIQQCGVTACPADAVKKVKKSVNMVTEAKGGEGAVREFCEYLVVRCSSRRDNEIADYEFSEIKFEEQ
jgi:YrbI family 3-deoxy-D-manno-octulosonate 8-phosphate phosphatase